MSEDVVALATAKRDKLEQGDKQKAVDWYRRALEVDPASENAKRMLEKLTADKSDS